ncbi:MAG: protein-methionine-sulfoxide reductase catalytic subunit MsrP [Pseudomonadota bacterium]
MNYLRRPRWRLPESAVTPEAAFWNRRMLMRAGLGAAAATVVAGCGEEGGGEANAQISGLFGGGDVVGLDTPQITPAPPLNPTYADAGRPVTDEEVNGSYNNFYEFDGGSKRIFRAAQALDTDGWTVECDGLVERPQTIGMEDLLSQMPLEERIYRHRCVERWAMVAPWIGFQLSALMDRVSPLSGAKYVRFESFYKPEIAPGQRNPLYPWPYVEGLTLQEAAHPLTFIVVGAYGKILPKQFGAPIRLHTPWKYGFKCNKSIIKITFTDQRPIGLWEELQSREYGFWANVNPDVAHPRWSQAVEEMLGTGERVPTQIYNGYGEEVADLYAGMGDLGDALFR